MRRTAETLSSLPTIQNSGYSPERQMLLALPQGEEGKGTPELIRRMSRKGEQAGKTEKQVSNCDYCCLLDTTLLTRGPFWPLWVTLLGVILKHLLSLKP